MRLFAFALLAVIASLLSATTPTQAGSRCTARNSATATVAQIAGDPDRWAGRCVTVSGLVDGISIYEGGDGFYRLYPELVTPSSNGLRLGLDNRRVLGAARAFELATVTGRVQDCESVSDMVQASAAPGEIVFVSGYCHSHRGAYLWVEAIRSGPFSPPVRQLRRKADDYGDLAPAPRDWEHRAMVDEIVSRFLAALGSGDRETLLDLIHPYPDMEPDKEELQQLAFLLEVRKSPFAPLRRSAVAQTEIFIERYSDEGEIVVGSDTYASTVCFCPVGDCSGRWPIASFDADNMLSRPYACIEVRPYQAPPHGTRVNILVPMATVGMVEPTGP